MISATASNQLLRDLLTLLALSLSFISFLVNYRHARRSLALGRKPVIVFEYSLEVGWSLRNVGNGPALNLMVGEMLDDSVIDPGRIPALAKDAVVRLQQYEHRNLSLVAIYSDPEEIQYTALIENDRSRILPGIRGKGWGEQALILHKG